MKVSGKSMRSLQLCVTGLLLLMFITGLGISPSLTQSVPVPTLVPPTPLPTIPPTQAETLPAETTVARILRDGRLRVGILFNSPPYSELNVRGVVSGFDADIANSLKDAWGVEIEYVQVTRRVEAAVELLRSGAVDMVMTALPHRRDLDAFVEFSQTYYVSRYAMLVRAENATTNVAEMNGRTVGVVAASSAEAALARWQARTGFSVNVQTFPTLDRAYVALAAGAVEAVVDQEARLRAVSAAQSEAFRLLDGVVEPEPRAIAVRRQDSGMRDLINRTLQLLTQTGRMNEIKQIHFPGAAYDTIRPWRNVGEALPPLESFTTPLVFPSQYILPRLQAEPVLRVAGIHSLDPANPDIPESVRRFNVLNQAVIDEFARRWNVTVEYLPDSAANALELVATGQADIAIGVAADWSVAGRVDFIDGFYLLRGDRLMAKVQGETEGFIGLRGGRVVATDIRDPEAVTRMQAAADGNVSPFQTRESDFALTMLEDLNADVAFADILQLIPHLEQYPDLLQITDEWYSQSVVTLAVPRNDVNFRLLVDYTLQEMIQDGTLGRLLTPVSLPGELPAFDLWPGSGDHLAFRFTAP